MKYGQLATLAMALSAQAVAADASLSKEALGLKALLPGVYSNYEQITFANEVPGAKPSPSTEIALVAKGDGFDMIYTVGGKQVARTPVNFTPGADGIVLGNDICSVPFRAVGDVYLSVEDKRKCLRAPAFMTAISARGITFRNPDGTFADFRRTRNFTCWVAAPKTAKKADGSTDWAFMPGLKIHDQGGRLWTQTDEATPVKIGLKLRSVVWPTGTNKPALTLYVYKPDDLEKAVSYAWADPEAKLVGINLRWMQGSCSRDQ